MRKKVTPLTSTGITNAKPKKKRYRLTDGAGLYLLITPQGAKHWRLDYILDGTRKTYAIGKYSEISLKAARESRKEAKDLIAKGFDPVQHRKATKRLSIEGTKNTFGARASEWLSLQKTWTEGHARTVKSRLKCDILPWMGHRPINDSLAPEILTVLRRIGFSKEEMTPPHGFRSMASTLLYENALLHENGHPAEIIELQLAHARRDQVATAYDSSTRLQERKEMMQLWADYLDRLEKGYAADQVHQQAAI